MKLCPNCDPVGDICDFCVHYDFNPGRDGVYTDNGWCRKHKQPKQPEDGCDDFNCEDRKENRQAKKAKERRAEISKKLNGQVHNK
jgi:Zn-finger nucleic acid-binding protein